MPTNSFFQRTLRGPEGTLASNPVFASMIANSVPALLKQYTSMAQPGINAQVMQAQRAGSALSQNIAASIGAVGGGGTGLGDISRSLGSSLAGYAGAQAYGQANMALLQQAIQSHFRSQEIGLERQRLKQEQEGGFWDKLFGGAAMALPFIPGGKFLKWLSSPSGATQWRKMQTSGTPAVPPIFRF